MIKEPKGKYKYRCVACDAIIKSDDPRAVIYCQHENGIRVMMTRRPQIKFRPQRLEA